MKCIRCKRVQPCALALHLLLHRQKIFENMFYNFLLRYHRSRNKKGEGGGVENCKEGAGIGASPAAAPHGGFGFTF